MIGIVVVTHCNLANALLETAKIIVGEIKQTAVVSQQPKDGPEIISKNIAKAIENVDTGNGVLILTDMFGGTPSNISLTFLDQKKVEVITGVNLPMLIKLSTIQEQNADLHEIAQIILEYGKKNISMASEILYGLNTKDDN